MSADDDGVGPIYFRAPTPELRVPYQVLLDADLSDGARLTYAILLLCAVQKKRFPGFSRFAKLRGLSSTGTLRTQLCELEDRKLLSMSVSPSGYWIEPYDSIYGELKATAQPVLDQGTPTGFAIISGLVADELPAELPPERPDTWEDSSAPLLVHQNVQQSHLFDIGEAASRQRKTKKKSADIGGVWKEYWDQVCARWPDTPRPIGLSGKDAGMIKRSLLGEFEHDVVVKIIRLAVWDWAAIREWRSAFRCGSTPTLANIVSMRAELAANSARGVTSQQNRRSAYYDKFVANAAQDDDFFASVRQQTELPSSVSDAVNSLLGGDTAKTNT